MLATRRRRGVVALAARDASQRVARPPSSLLRPAEGRIRPSGQPKSKSQMLSVRGGDSSLPPPSPGLRHKLPDVARFAGLTARCNLGPTHPCARSFPAITVQRRHDRNTLRPFRFYRDRASRSLRRPSPWLAAISVRTAVNVISAGSPSNFRINFAPRELRTEAWRQRPYDPSRRNVLPTGEAV